MTEYSWQFCDEHNESYEDGDSCPYCRISELEAKLERVLEIRRRVKSGIEVSAGLDDEIGVYWQELFLDMIDKALADD